MAVAEDHVQIPWGNKFFRRQRSAAGRCPRFRHGALGHDPDASLPDHQHLCGADADHERPRTFPAAARTSSVTRRKLEPRKSGFVEVEMNGRNFQGAKAVTIQVRFGPKYRIDRRLASARIRTNRRDAQSRPDQLQHGSRSAKRLRSPKSSTFSTPARNSTGNISDVDPPVLRA